MTVREKELFKVYYSFYTAYTGEAHFILTGSLVLALRDIKKPREANDVDVLVTTADLFLDEFEGIPRGFTSQDIDTDSRGRGNYIVKARFYNQDLDIKIEFITKDHHFEDGCDYRITDEDLILLGKDLSVAKNKYLSFPCSQVLETLEAKRLYAVNPDDPNRQKHLDDITYICLNNSFADLMDY